MLIFAASDKGGTGRSVTSSNVAYRQALRGLDSCYLDFDFGSPTAGAIFELPRTQAGVPHGGLHSYLVDGERRPARLDVWEESQRASLRGGPAGAAGGLVHGPHGILDTGSRLGHDRQDLHNAIRSVRTAVQDLAAPDQEGSRPEQLAWLAVCDNRLRELAAQSRMGLAKVLGTIPLDPVLQWQEQLLSDDDILLHRTANTTTVAAFEEPASRITDDTAWEGL